MTLQKTKAPISSAVATSYLNPQTQSKSQRWLTAVTHVVRQRFRHPHRTAATGPAAAAVVARIRPSICGSQAGALSRDSARSVGPAGAVHHVTARRLRVAEPGRDSSQRERAGATLRVGEGQEGGGVRVTGLARQR